MTRLSEGGTATLQSQNMAIRQECRNASESRRGEVRDIWCVAITTSDSAMNGVV